MEMVPHVHLVPGVLANPYLIVDPEGLTLIDTGLPGSHRKILKYIAGLGHKPTDLKRILLTHSDLDHVGGLAALKKVSGARVCASAIEAEAIAKGEPSRRLKPPQVFRRILMSVLGRLVKATPVQTDEILGGGQTLPVLGGLEVIETPGHTPGHLSFFVPSASILFVGDSIVSDTEGLHGSRPALSWDQARAAESVRKQILLKPNIICSGHGPVVKDAVDKMPAP